MKLTEEQKVIARNLIQLAFNESGIFGHTTDVVSAAQGALDAVEDAVEKFSGIQWNPYPETKPEAGKYIATDDDRICDAIYDADRDSWSASALDPDDPEDSYISGYFPITHYVEINLPIKPK